MGTAPAGNTRTHGVTNDKSRDEHEDQRGGESDRVCHATDYGARC